MLAAEAISYRLGSSQVKIACQDNFVLHSEDNIGDNKGGYSTTSNTNISLHIFANNTTKDSEAKECHRERRISVAIANFTRPVNQGKMF